MLDGLKSGLLNPIDQSLALSALLQDFGFTYEQLANFLFRSRESLVAILRLLKLEVPIQRALADGTLLLEHAALLLKLANVTERLFLFKKILEDHLSPSECESHINQLLIKNAPLKNHDDFKQKTFNEVALDLKQRLTTEVIVTQSPKGGKIVIEFLDVEDLSRILRLLGVEISAI